MNLTCKYCGADIPDSNIDRERSFAKCPKCAAIFHCDVGAPETTSGPTERRRPHVAMPANITITPQSGGSGRAFTIERRWYDFRFLIFAIAWVVSGVMSFVVLSTVSHGAHPPPFLPFFWVEGAVFEIGFGYVVAAGFLNRTTITANNGVLSVRIGPLPWTGNGEFAIKEIKQLYCEQKVIRNKNTISHVYAVIAMLKSGGRKALIKSLPRADQALFIEQEIESRLKIVDVAVEGEYAGRMDRN